MRCPPKRVRRKEMEYLAVIFAAESVCLCVRLCFVNRQTIHRCHGIFFFPFSLFSRSFAEFSLLLRRLLIVYGRFRLFRIVRSHLILCCMLLDTISNRIESCVFCVDVVVWTVNNSAYEIIAHSKLDVCVFCHRRDNTTHTHTQRQTHVPWHYTHTHSLTHRSLYCVTESLVRLRRSRYYLIYRPVESSIRNALECLCFVRCNFWRTSLRSFLSVLCGNRANVRLCVAVLDSLFRRSSRAFHAIHFAWIK